MALKSIFNVWVAYYTDLIIIFLLVIVIASIWGLGKKK